MANSIMVINEGSQSSYVKGCKGNSGDTLHHFLCDAGYSCLRVPAMGDYAAVHTTPSYIVTFGRLESGQTVVKSVFVPERELINREIKGFTCRHTCGNPDRIKRGETENKYYMDQGEDFVKLHKDIHDDHMKRIAGITYNGVPLEQFVSCPKGSEDYVLYATFAGTTILPNTIINFDMYKITKNGCSQKLYNIVKDDNLESYKYLMNIIRQINENGRYPLKYIL